MRQRGDTSARTTRTADYGECGQVDNWKDQSAAFPTTWIQQHIQDATAMRKPVSLCQSRQALRRPALFELRVRPAAPAITSCCRGPAFDAPGPTIASLLIG